MYTTRKWHASNNIIYVHFYELIFAFALLSHSIKFIYSDFFFLHFVRCARKQRHRRSANLWDFNEIYAILKGREIRKGTTENEMMQWIMRGYWCCYWQCWLTMFLFFFQVDELVFCYTKKHYDVIFFLMIKIYCYCDINLEF